MNRTNNQNSEQEETIESLQEEIIESLQELEKVEKNLHLYESDWHNALQNEYNNEIAERKAKLIEPLNKELKQVNPQIEELITEIKNLFPIGSRI